MSGSKNKGLVQNTLWVQRRRYSQLQTGYKNVERRYAEELKLRRDELEKLAAFIKSLEEFERVGQ